MATVSAGPALSETEARLRAAVETMLDGFAILSARRDAAGQIADFRFEYINPAGRQVGSRVDAISPGQMLFELMPAGTPAGLFDALARVVETEQPFRTESVSIAWGGRGEAHVYDLRAVRLDDGVAVTWRDVTERRRMEEALQASEERYRSLFENSLDAILLTTPAGAILAANSEACRMFGRTEDELRQIGRAGVVDVTDPRLAAALEEREHTGKARAELTYVREDGTTFQGEVSSAVFRDRGGSLRSSMFIRDVTERKRAEGRFERETARAQALLRTAARLNAQLDLQVVLAAVCEEAAGALGVPAAWINLYDEARDMLYFAAGVGLPADFGQFYVSPPRSLFDEYSMRFGPTIVIPDVQALRDIPNIRAYAAIDARTVANAGMWRSGALVGVLSVVTFGQSRQFSADELALLKGLAHQASLAIANARLFERVQEQGRRLRALSTQVAEMEENQRHQLARELHDRVGQNLTVLSINLSILRGQLSAELAQRAGARLDDSLALLEQTTERIRDVMADLRPPALDDYGLLAALRWYAGQFTQRTGVPALVQGVDLAPRPSAALEIVLFRIAQEALTNVAKHARAGQAMLNLETEGDIVRLTIGDDGIGFEPALTMGPAGRKGWGLLNMRERAEALGGEFRIESCPGRGSVVIVEAPR